MFPVIILAIENEDDREFMMQLYTQYRALLYSEIYKIVQNEWDADDVLQSVIEKLIDRLSKLREMEHKGRVMEFQSILLLEVMGQICLRNLRKKYFYNSWIKCIAETVLL